MKILSTSLVLMLGSSLLLPALTASELSREEDLRKVQACVHSSSGQECNDIKAAAETLARLYRQGDKSVLPALMEDTSMGELFADALLDDTAGYLRALSTLPAPRQGGVEATTAGDLFGLPRERFEALQSALANTNSELPALRQGVEDSMAGGGFGLSRERFEALQSALLKISPDSPGYPLAQSSLRQLRVANARLLTTYFPPHVFTSRAGDFLANWYSSELYALDEAPLWPPTANQHQYRFTFLPSMSLNASVTLTVSDDNVGVIRVRHGAHVLPAFREKTLTLTPKQLNDLLTLIAQADFWRMPVEIDRRGPWRLECIMEGVRDGQYHVVTRSAPEQSAYNDLGAAFIKLSELAK